MIFALFLPQLCMSAVFFNDVAENYVIFGFGPGFGRRPERGTARGGHGGGRETERTVGPGKVTGKIVNTTCARVFSRFPRGVRPEILPNRRKTSRAVSIFSAVSPRASPAVETIH